MTPHTQNIGDFKPPIPSLPSPCLHVTPKYRRLQAPRRTAPPIAAANDGTPPKSRRREFILVPSLAIAAGSLLPIAASRAEEKAAAPPAPQPDAAVVKEEEGDTGDTVSRVYDATVIGEPQAVGKGKSRVWEKLLGARVVYLGEAELVPDRDDRELELEIVRNLQGRCLEVQRTLTLALQGFPCGMQEQLNQFMDGRYHFFDKEES